MWFYYALFNGFCFSIIRTFDKSLADKYNANTISFMMLSFSIIPILLLFFVFPIPADIFSLSFNFWWPLLSIWFIVFPLQNHFYYKALSLGEVSSVTSLFCLLPVFNVFTSYLTLGEVPSRYGVFGIIIIVLGIFILLKKGKLIYESDQVRREKDIKSIYNMITAMVLLAIGTTLDKVSLKESTPIFYSFANRFGAALIFLFLIWKNKKLSELVLAKEKFLAFTVIGIMQAVSYYAMMIAFMLAPTSYALSVRSCSFVFVALWGVIFFKEKLTLRKITAFALFVIGILFLVK